MDLKNTLPFSLDISWATCNLGRCDRKVPYAWRGVWSGEFLTSTFVGGHVTSALQFSLIVRLTPQPLPGLGWQQATWWRDHAPSLLVGLKGQQPLCGDCVPSCAWTFRATLKTVPNSRCFWHVALEGAGAEDADLSCSSISQMAGCRKRSRASQNCQVLLEQGAVFQSWTWLYIHPRRAHGDLWVWDILRGSEKYWRLYVWSAFQIRGAPGSAASESPGNVSAVSILGSHPGPTYSETLGTERDRHLLKQSLWSFL